ncbi:unnamed protein product [Cladocopium goreaui]|uniref:Uncharacterized protein n=1 Tax=Cladocopium goreaui TaxID=2562237 RepID=A0A9P1GQ03_9DINO|nr:unnamed protein product [Cladocopium goreaui]
MHPVGFLEFSSQDAARWDDVLSSDRQRAVLRSLQAATSLGIPEADMLVQELAADFCRCERLARAARRAHAQVAKQSKPKAAQVERWRLAPFRCVAEVEREEARPHTERGPRSPRVLRPLDLQIGPVRSCDGLDVGGPKRGPGPGCGCESHGNSEVPRKLRG